MQPNLIRTSQGLRQHKAGQHKSEGLSYHTSGENSGSICLIVTQKQHQTLQYKRKRTLLPVVRQKRNRSLTSGEIIGSSSASSSPSKMPSSDTSRSMRSGDAADAGLLPLLAACCACCGGGGARSHMRTTACRSKITVHAGLSAAQFGLLSRRCTSEVATCQASCVSICHQAIVTVPAWNAEPLAGVSLERSCCDVLHQQQCRIQVPSCA